jgi:phage portal protein BeeE
VKKGIFSGLFHSRDKPKDSLAGRWSFLFGVTTSGKAVNERTAMQTTAVYACVRILSEAVAGLPIHIYRYRTDGGKERVPMHPLYRLLHDEPNPEMTSFVFRETLMSHLLIWGNAYAQVIRTGAGRRWALPASAEQNGRQPEPVGRLLYTYYRDADESGVNPSADTSRSGGTKSCTFPGSDSTG